MPAQYVLEESPAPSAAKRSGTARRQDHEPAAPAAERAGLRYVSDSEPGIRRIGAGTGFSYRWIDGTRITGRKTLRRIKALVIPPAWTDVWICPRENGHIQATGRDKRGRKQYRYHSRWRQLRDTDKFDRMVDFADALPAIRDRLRRDMAKRGLPREKVLAAAVALLEQALIRVGNAEYARDNESFGVTTLHDDHVELDGATICLTFRGKNRSEVETCITDPRLARVIRSCHDIPGQQLFQYRGDREAMQPVDSGDVNAYIRAAAGGHFSAKDFRTWAGTVLMVRELHRLGPAANKTQAKRNAAAAAKRVASSLCNTPAVARKSYIHPEVVVAYEDGQLLATLEEGGHPSPGRRSPSLRALEPVVRELLRQRAGSV